MKKTSCHYGLFGSSLLLKTNKTDGDIVPVANMDWLLGEYRLSEHENVFGPAIEFTRVKGPITHGLTDLQPIPVREDVLISLGLDKDGRRITVFDEDAVLKCGADGNSTILVGEDVTDVSYAVGAAQVFALEHALEIAKTSLVHAAGLILDDVPGIVLLHAPSGTGKSTTSLALAMAGARLVADDCTAVTLSADDQGPKAWGLPRSAKVHKRSFDMMPSLRERLDFATLEFQQDEAMVDRAKLTAAGLAVRQQSLEPVAAVINLRANHHGAACVVNIQEPFAAMHALMEDNLAVGQSGLDAVQELRLDVLSKLVGHAPCLEVQVAGPPENIANTIIDAVRRING